MYLLDTVKNHFISEHHGTICSFSSYILQHLLHSSILSGPPFDRGRPITRLPPRHPQPQDVDPGPMEMQRGQTPEQARQTPGMAAGPPVQDDPPRAQGCVAGAIPKHWNVLPEFEDIEGKRKK